MKVSSSIARYLCLFCTWLSATIGLFLATNSHSYELHIKGAEILSGQAIEGGLIIARTAPSNQVTLADDVVRVAKNGVFVIGFHRDSDTPETLAITTPDGNTIKTTLLPEQRDYKIQRINGLKSAMVTPPAAVRTRIKADGEAVRAARNIDTPLGDFWQGFDWPAHGQISGVYGSQRILNGQARQPHYGIDIASPLGTPVYAPANGRITLVKDLYFSGWTIVIAHGLGVNSSFLHLDKTMVKPGAFVKRGAVIGTIGATGRATGPHLDWRIDWQGRRIDPALLVGPMPPK
ncbi:MAG: M23 family metallopeptidase [Candidatus Puniceispirillaceae bacterium]